MQEMQVRSLGWKDPLEKEMAAHSNILAWEIPWTEEPGRLQSTGLQESRTQLSNQTTARKRNNVFCLLWEMQNSKWPQFVTCHLAPRSELQYSTVRSFQKCVCVRSEGQARNKRHALELNLLESCYVLMLHLPFWAQSVQFSSVRLLSRVRLFATPWIAARQASLSITNEFTQTQVHRVGDAIQPSHPLSSPSPPAPNPSQHQALFQWVSSSQEVAKVLVFQF